MTDYYKDYEAITPREKYGPRFDADDVYIYHDSHECSMMEAEKELMRRQILKDLDIGRNIHDIVLLYDILEYMIENRYV